VIYTCYEMIRDCRDGKPEGWKFFIQNYVPVIRSLLVHYGGSRDALDSVLQAIASPGSHLFDNVEPLPERTFVAELRQRVVSQLHAPPPEISLNLQAVAGALQPLTVVEKHASWLESMRYSPQQSGAMLRMSPVTVEKIRARAADLVRAELDTWNSGILAANGLALSREAAAARTPDCLPAKTFLDVLDGRTTWLGRETLEAHVSGCWHCIDHFCRLVEVLEQMRAVQPLTPEETAHFSRLLGVEMSKPPAWKRWLGAL
jgi:hypothetical protein